MSHLMGTQAWDFMPLPSLKFLADLFRTRPGIAFTERISLATVHMQMSALNCCISRFLMYEGKEEMHLRMCIQMKYSRLLMKYSVSLAFLWATPPVELLLRKEAASVSLQAASASRLNSACLFSALYSLSGIDYSLPDDRP